MSLLSPLEAFLASLSPEQRTAYRALVLARRDALQGLLATLAEATSQTYAPLGESGLELHALDRLAERFFDHQGGLHELPA